MAEHSNFKESYLFISLFHLNVEDEILSYEVECIYIVIKVVCVEDNVY